jgi:hypothetical protein
MIQLYGSVGKGNERMVRKLNLKNNLKEDSRKIV